MENKHPKVLCVTANPCTDKLIWYRTTPDKPTRVFRQLGGKGINVARMMAWLGCDTSSLTIGRADGSDRMKSLAEREPCNTILVPVQQPVREIPTFINRTEGKAEVGYVNTNRMECEEAAEFLCRYRELLSGQDMVIISGSACAGAAEIFPEMVRRAKEQGIPVMLDSYGDCFVKALPEGPDFVKPNREELEKTIGSVPEGEEIAGARKLIQMGAGTVLLSTGEGYSYLVTNTSADKCESFRVPTVSAIGCGDSFVAYFCFGFLQGMDIRRCFEIGRAAGAANAQQAFSGRVHKEQVNRILRRAGCHEM